VKLFLALVLSQALVRTVATCSLAPTGDEILARIEIETNRRQTRLQEYSGARLYTLQNRRFGKEAAVSVRMDYRHAEADRYTVVKRSGSERLNGIIDQLLASEAGASAPPENTRHDIAAVNYRARLLRSEVADGRSLYVLELTPRIKSRYLIVGKAWINAETYGVVRIEGRFAASFSVLLGAPRIIEDFIEVQGFWLPGHVTSVTSSVLLGSTELEIVFSNYELGQLATAATARRTARVMPGNLSLDPVPW
jgi:hypothetical protein